MENFQEIKNIFCIGRNYAKHAKELGNDIPKKPMVFTKPTHSLYSSQGELMLSPDLGEVHYEVELVVRIAESYQQGKPLNQVIDGLSLGIDLTARSIQSKLKEKGHPWLLAKGFKGAAILGDFIPFQDIETNKIEFSLMKNGEVVQVGNPTQMIFPLEKILAFISDNFGLEKGDIIYTGTPEGVGQIEDGDVLEMKLVTEEKKKYWGPLKIIGAK